MCVRWVAYVVYIIYACMWSFTGVRVGYQIPAEIDIAVFIYSHTFTTAQGMEGLKCQYNSLVHSEILEQLLDDFPYWLLDEMAYHLHGNDSYFCLAL